ncbi:hypothetical protein, partial [Proteus faecis]|uniref:hypothetical protein n=1 Tax=Proteus faecis TaxID=2050967 RepID=UPI003075D75D
YNGPDTASAINSKTVAELILNRSRAANGTAPDGTYDYEPDVGYTYPDLNGIFLAYDYIIDDLGTSPRIIKPSFMDLDLFRNLL